MLQAIPMSVGPVGRSPARPEVDAETGYAYLDRPRRDMIPFVPAPARSVLDVGCGRGGFGAALKEARLEADRPVSVTGIEADAEAAATARQRYDQVVTGLFPHDLPDGSAFDCIVFNDILEHLVDPWDALRRARDLIRPGGSVVASIPNMRYWPVFWRLVARGEWRYASDGVLDRTHLRFFTAGSVREMFAGAGYTLRELKPINPVEMSELEPASRRILKLVGWWRPSLQAELRAQQFAVVARPIHDPVAPAPGA